MLTHAEAYCCANSSAPLYSNPTQEGFYSYSVENPNEKPLSHYGALISVDSGFSFMLLRHSDSPVFLCHSSAHSGSPLAQLRFYSPLRSKDIHLLNRDDETYTLVRLAPRSRTRCGDLWCALPGNVVLMEHFQEVLSQPIRTIYIEI